MKHYIQRFENAVNDNSLINLLRSMRRLYCVAYARLNIEIENIKLCDSYQLDIRCMTSNRDEYLPEPSHLILICQACKMALETDDILDLLGREAEKVDRYQEDYVRHAVEIPTFGRKHISKIFDYHNHVQNVVSDRNSIIYKKMGDLPDTKKVTPEKVVARLSETYLNLHLKNKSLQLEYDTQRMVRASRRRTPPSIGWEEEKHILAHREAALAMVNGQVAGEFRRTEGTWAMMQYVRENLCVCGAHCSCARVCTLESNRLCPCSARISALHSNDRPMNKRSFAKKCSRVALAVFEGLCMGRRDVGPSELQAELKTGWNVFHEEMVRFRAIPRNLV